MSEDAMSVFLEVSYLLDKAHEVREEIEEKQPDLDEETKDELVRKYMSYYYGDNASYYVGEDDS